MKGGLHIITRAPQPFRVRPSFVDASIKGTRYEVRVTDDSTRVSRLWEGQDHGVEQRRRHTYHSLGGNGRNLARHRAASGRQRTTEGRRGVDAAGVCSTWPRSAQTPTRPNEQGTARPLGSAWTARQLVPDARSTGQNSRGAARGRPAPGGCLTPPRFCCQVAQVDESPSPTARPAGGTTQRPAATPPGSSRPSRFVQNDEARGAAPTGRRWRLDPRPPRPGFAPLVHRFVTACASTSHSPAPEHASRRSRRPPGVGTPRRGAALSREARRRIAAPRAPRRTPTAASAARTPCSASRTLASADAAAAALSVWPGDPPRRGRPLPRLAFGLARSSAAATSPPAPAASRVRGKPRPGSVRSHTASSARRASRNTTPCSPPHDSTRPSGSTPRTRAHRLRHRSASVANRRSTRWPTWPSRRRGPRTARSTARSSCLTTTPRPRHPPRAHLQRPRLRAARGGRSGEAADRRPQRRVVAPLPVRLLRDAAAHQLARDSELLQAQLLQTAATSPLFPQLHATASTSSRPRSRRRPGSRYGARDRRRRARLTTEVGGGERLSPGAGRRLRGWTDCRSASARRLPDRRLSRQRPAAADHRQRLAMLPLSPTAAGHVESRESKKHPGDPGIMSSRTRSCRRCATPTTGACSGSACAWAPGPTAHCSDLFTPPARRQRGRRSFFGHSSNIDRPTCSNAATSRHVNARCARPERLSPPPRHRVHAAERRHAARRGTVKLAHAHLYRDWRLSPGAAVQLGAAYDRLDTVHRIQRRRVNPSSASC